MSYRIRTLTLADYEAAAALWQSLPGIGWDGPSDSRAGIARFLRRNRGLSLAAEDGGALVGTALVGHDGRRAFIYHLAIAPSHAGRGIGRALVARALRSLAACGVPKCSVLVLDTNTGGAAFWQKIGWTRRGDVHVFQHATPLS